MPKHALIVDDSRMARIIIQNILERLPMPWSAAQASNSEEALAKIGAEKFDAIFVDLSMPGMGGLDLISHIRDRHPEIPIAIVSANAQASIQEKGRTLGIPVLGKPVEPEVIESFVAELA